MRGHCAALNPVPLVINSGIRCTSSGSHRLLMFFPRTTMSSSEPPSTAQISDAERSLLSIPGNAPEESKATLAGMMEAIFGIREGYSDGFALDVARRLRLTEVSVKGKEEESSRQEWKVVFEAIVEPGAPCKMH